MRGIFTAGVLDSFMEKKVEFPYVIGVSMGAYLGASYISKQSYRGFKVLTHAVHSQEFIDLKRILHHKAIVNFDFIFNEIDKKVFPFKSEDFDNDLRELAVVTTNCIDGNPEYLYKKQGSNKEYYRCIQASCAYPVLSDIVNIDNTPYLDGGISDSIPIKHVLEKGKEKIVIILTHPKGFKESSLWYYNISKVLFRRYPKITEAILKRSSEYNATLKVIEKLEKEGKAFVIRPSKMDMDIAEHDTIKILRHYEMGLQEGLSVIEDLKDWLVN